MPELRKSSEVKRVVGIIAGGGSLPAEIAASLVARRVGVRIVAIDGEADADFTAFPVTRLRIGSIGAMLKAFQDAGAREIVLIGRVRRPDLWQLKPDLGFLAALGEILTLIMKGGGDDRLLRGVIAFFEKRGLKVIGPQDVAPELLVAQGVLAHVQPGPAAAADIAMGMEIVGRLGRFDIGQGVVVAGGRIEAIEASENTDRMLERVARARRRAGIALTTRTGVLVKRPKPQQDRRIDLPAIGPETVSRAADAALAGIAVEAGGTITARRDELIVRADTAELFVVGAEPLPRPSRPAVASRPELRAGPWRALTRIGARADDIAEADLAGGIARKLADYDAGRAVIVARQHVLAVEAGEGVIAAIERAAGERQWGDQRSRRRRGVVLLHGVELTPDIVAAASAARLKGLALFAARSHTDAIVAAERLRLFVVAATWQRHTQPN